MNDFLYSMDKAPVNRFVVFFEQWGNPFVGYLDERGKLCFDEDQYEGENHDGPASVYLTVNKEDLAGWQPLPKAPPYDNWNKFVI